MRLNPCVSVVIPVYNMEKFLDKCLLSVLNQTFNEFEIIIVNDGSTDSSEKIIDDFCSKYPDIIRKINKENGGLADTLNVGAKNSSGQYLFFLDSDDYIAKDCLEVLVSKALMESADVVISGQYKVDENGGILQTISYKPVDGKCYRLRLNLHGKLYKREYILDNNITCPSGFLYEDNSFNLQAYFLTSKIAFVDYNGYFQLVREGSITSKAITKDRLPIEEWERVIKRVYFKEDTDKELFEFTIFSLFAYLLFVRIRKREFKKIKNEKFDNTQNGIMIADEFERIVLENFDLKKHNRYMGIKKIKQIDLKQKIAVLVFRESCRRKKLSKLTNLIYKI